MDQRAKGIVLNLWLSLQVHFIHVNYCFQCLIADRMDQQSTGPRMLGWNVKPEDLHQIPEHWFKYPEPDPLQNYMLGLLYVLFTFVSLFGNGLVIWIFSTWVKIIMVLLF